MSKLRTTTGTALTALVLGSGSMALAAPSAHAEVPANYEASTTQAATSQHRTLASHTTRATSSARLVFGTRSEAVRALQAKLTDAGFEVPQTGYFGSITRGALRDFQRAHDLAPTGKATPRTLALLGGSSTSTATSLRSTSVTSSVSSSPVASSSSQSSTKASSSAAQAAVNFAYSQLGTPYVYGGTGNGGYDCSGLTQAAWASAGVSIPRTSYAQWSGLQSVSTSNLQPGDLVVFYGGGHIGIYVGDGMVIHAPRPGRSVEKVSMNTMPISGAVRPA